MRCPTCNTTTRIQRTHVITEYLRDIVHCCNNKECAHIFVTQQEFIRTVMPSLLESEYSKDDDNEADSTSPVT